MAEISATAYAVQVDDLTLAYRQKPVLWDVEDRKSVV